MGNHLKARLIGKFYELTKARDFARREVDLTLRLFNMNLNFNFSKEINKGQYYKLKFNLSKQQYAEYSITD